MSLIIRVGHLVSCGWRRESRGSRRRIFDVLSIVNHAGAEERSSFGFEHGRSRISHSAPRQYVIAAGVVIGVALLSFFFVPLAGVHAIALIFLLAVVLLALFVDRGPTFLAAAMSALLWDYCFLPPVFAFRVTHFEDAMLLLTYFVVALALGQLTGRIHAHEFVAQQREARATALYLLTRELSSVADIDHLAQRIVSQLEGVFEAKVILFL